MAISERVAAPLYRFVLQNASKGALQLFYAPDGWKDAKFELKRNPVYHGLFRSITFNQLTFRKDGRDFIRDVYEMSGINAVIFFTVYRLDSSTGDYTTYFSGKLDLSTYRIDETGVTCQVIDTQLAEKVKNRENQKVNIREHTSIEGFDIPEFSDENPVIKLPDYVIRALATWDDRGQNTSTLDNHNVPLLLINSEFTEAQHQSCTVTPGDGENMFEDSTADRTLNLSGNVTGQITFASEQPHVTFRVRLFQNETPIATIGTVTGSSVWSLVFNFDFDEDFSILTGDDFSLRGSLDHSGTTEYTSVSVVLAEEQVSVSGGNVIAYPYHEALQRVLQIITDSYDCLKSDKFGRTDSEVVTYASDGQLGCITRGLFIRGSYGLNNSLSLSLADLFNSLSALFCLGMGVEDVGGTDKVVIEDLDYFYDSTVTLDLSARIREAAIVKEVLPELHYSSVKTGYQSYEYLTAGGLAEFNTSADFATVISVLENKFERISRYRADTQGIVLLRKNVETNDDVKGDDDCFVIDAVRIVDPLTAFQARTDEDFTLVTGGADAENSFNLDYTPKRNLLRNGALIRAGLEKNLGTYLRWQAGEKNTTLSTRRTAEADPLVENADIMVNDLEEPWFLPEKYIFQCELRYSDLSAILANPRGIVKLSGTKYGWLLNLKIGAKENLAEIELLRVNLNVITPVE